MDAPGATCRIPARIVVDPWTAPEPPCHEIVQPPDWLPASSALEPATYTFADLLNGSTPSFLSSTCDSAAALRAFARWSAVPKSLCLDASGNGCSNSPSRNFSRRIRLTASSTRVKGTEPELTAFVKDASNAWYSYGVITMSMPALMDVTTAWS